MAPFEVLRHGAAAGADFDVALVGVDGPGSVRAANGLRVQVDSGLGQPDAVIVPGGGWLDGSSAGARAEAERGVLTARLVELAPSLRWTASVCTGAMLLAEAGLLRGRSATTNHGAIDQLSQYGASARIERVVDDGPVITAGGPSAGLDLGLWLIEREAGRVIADAAAGGDRVRPARGRLASSRYRCELTLERHRLGGRLTLELGPVQLGVLTVEGEQRAVRTTFDDASGVDHQDAVGVQHGRESMGDHQ